MTSIDQINSQKQLLETELTHQSLVIKNELHKIDSLEAKLKQMQSQLFALNKVEKSCDKKNKDELHSTFVTIRNKLILTENHNRTNQRYSTEKKYLNQQKGKVKDLRDKEIHELENAKRENQRVKQNMMKEVREISNKNQSVIRKMKQSQIQQNRHKAEIIKNQKQSYRQSLMQSKIRQIKQRHQLEMSRSQIRIQKKDELQKKYQELMKEKQVIENRVNQKKEYNKRLQVLKKQISHMKDEEINKTIKQIKKKLKNYETNKEQQDDNALTQSQKDEEYIKFKLFEKYYEAEQKRRQERLDFVY